MQMILESNTFAYQCIQHFLVVLELRSKESSLLIIIIELFWFTIG